MLSKVGTSTPSQPRSLIDEVKVEIDTCSTLEETDPLASPADSLALAAEPATEATLDKVHKLVKIKEEPDWDEDGEFPMDSGEMELEGEQQSTDEIAVRLELEEELCGSSNVKKRKRKNKNKRFECPFPDCDFVTPIRRTLLRHVQAHVGDRKFACNQCEYRTNFSFNLSAHMRTHTGEKPFACNLCPYKTSSQVSVLRHVRSHANKSDIFNVSGERDLKAHPVIINADETFTCILCDIRMTRKEDLVTHMKNHEPKRLSCDLCEFTTNHITHMKEHKMIHTGEKPYACDHCGFRTRIQRNLRDHMTTHSIVKPFACKVCNYKTGRKNLLLRHQRSRNHGGGISKDALGKSTETETSRQPAEPSSFSPPPLTSYSYQSGGTEQN